MRKPALQGLLRVTRTARGAVKKTWLTFSGVVYVGLILSGVPVALYSFLQGGYFVGSRVLGILGIVLGVSATLVRVDAMDQLTLLSEEEATTIEDGGYTETDSLCGRIYREYVMRDSFPYLMYAFYTVGIVFMAISYIPVVF